MVGNGMDAMVNPGIPVDSYAVQPAQYNYGEHMARTPLDFSSLFCAHAGTLQSGAWL